MSVLQDQDYIRDREEIQRRLKIIENFLAGGKPAETVGWKSSFESEKKAHEISKQRIRELEATIESRDNLIFESRNKVAELLKVLDGRII